MSQRFNLSDDQIFTLSDKLRSVADEITREMAIACDGQARVAPSLAYVAPQFASRPPFPIGMRGLIEKLNGELGTTIRHLEEHGTEQYTGADATSTMAAWLNTKRYKIALLPDADEVFDRLVAVIDECTRSVNVNVERQFSSARYNEANRLWYTADQLEKLAPKLGTAGRGLTKRRVRHLSDAHGLRAHVDTDSGIARYRLGDVLSLHKTAPRRKSTPARSA